MAASSPRYGAVRTLVVDDSPFMRTIISDILEEGGIEVIGVAADGQEALELVDRFEPDVITMDVEMDGMDGLEAVDRIMTKNPTPILMLSAHTASNADVTLEAIERGAVDFFTKPGGEVSAGMHSHREQLVTHVLSVATAQTVESTGEPESVSQITRPRALTTVLETDPTLVIGSSTGGPRLVTQIMRNLPIQSAFRVMIVQHMPEVFTGRFAHRLDETSEYTVFEADDGDTLPAGHAAVAPGGTHLEVSEANGTLHLQLSDDPPIHGVRPAVDPTMISVADHVTGPLFGVILTGMGADGAVGIESIKAAGGSTFAQDRETSTVFGMPQRAIETGAVDHIIAGHEFVDRLLTVVSEVATQ